MLDEDAPDKLGRHRKEVSSILPLHALVIYKAHVSLIDKGGCLEAVPGALALHVAARHTVEFRVDDGRQSFQSALIPFPPSAQQPGNVTGGWWLALCGFLHVNWVDYNAAGGSGGSF
jgi:hypothetical protein